jgi:hypothetical protein
MSEQNGNRGTVERELAAIDAALADGAARDAEPQSRELQELALLLHADAPGPDPEFAERLGARVEAGFPAEPGSARARAESAASSLREAPRWAASAGRELLPALGVVAAIVLPLLVAVALIGPSGDEGQGGGGAGAALDGAAREQAPSGAGGGPLPAPRDRGFAPGHSDRRIERSFSLELAVPLDEMMRVAEEVMVVTDRHGGFVLRSSVDAGEDGGAGDFSLRIPTDRLRAALRDLAALAPVVRQTEEGRDVTRAHVTATDRLRGARAERRSLLRRLERADTDAEAEALRRRLDLIAGEINGLRARLRDLRLRTDYAVVLVALLAAEGDGAGAGAGGSLDDAIGDAGDLLVGTAGVLIRVLALALPIGLLAAPAWLVLRGVHRRRRESVLA